MEFVKIGKIINTHGIRGDLKIESYTDFEKERFKVGSTIYLGENHEEFKVHSYKSHKGNALVCLENYLDINLVLKFVGKDVYKAKDDIKPLRKGEYYFSDLKGLDVLVGNQVVGVVINMEEGVKYNFLRIKTGDRESLVPYLPAFVKNVDLEKKIIELVWMEGLL